MAALAVLCNLALGTSGCSCIGGKATPRPYAEPTVEMVLEHLASVRARARSFQAESVMDYWVGKDRVKGKVLIMGKTGARVRINALNPTGGNVAADLACDGGGFQFIDYNSNCQLTGPCNRDSVAQLLRVSLEPDDFLLLAVGTTPLIAGPHEGALRWDEKKAREVLTLTGAGGLEQTIVLAGKDRRWDVISSTVTSADGQTLWRLQNKDFTTIEVAGDPAPARENGADSSERPATDSGDEIPPDMADLKDATPDDFDDAANEPDADEPDSPDADPDADSAADSKPKKASSPATTIWRVPRKTRFTQPQDDADLLVRWVDRTLGAKLSDDKFRMAIPPGLPECR